jgi:hypothetical protein
MSVATYRFLPWSRRGLAAAIPGGQPDSTPIPARAALDIEIVVSGVANPVTNHATLHGPGNVIGLDPTVIVRTTPRDGSTNVEPNYLAAVDFDQPELPWLFTPAGAPASGRLLPWLVLVVVEDRPGVTLSVPRGALLPQLSITSGAAAELPDLADSWAWAHVQLMDSDAGPGTPEAAGAALKDHPNTNVSRLVCPRHLKPDTSWIAAVVPAFDAGVTRGMGGYPTAATLAPAWTGGDSVTLPVYYHWTFTTGPEGDFESLARRLRPFEVDSSVGRIRMHVGDAAPPIRLAPDDAGRLVDMDGALMAPTDSPGALQDVAPALRAGLASMAALVADAADGALDGRGDPTPQDGQPVGPPVYGQYAARRRVVQDGDPLWFREANVDPRGRVAAGLGAEVLRANQEDVVAAAWDQVGSVLEAQAALSRARLSLEAARRFHERHLVPSPTDRLFQLAAPLADRTLLGHITVAALTERTSLPTAVLDGAMRRLLAPGGRVMSGAAKRLGMDGPAVLRGSLVSALARGVPQIDATAFSWVAIQGAGTVRPADRGDGTVDYAPLGLNLSATVADRDLVLQAEQAQASIPAMAGPARFAARSDLATVGIVTQSQLDTARVVARAAVTQAPSGTDWLSERSVGTEGVLSSIVQASVQTPSADGVMIDLTHARTVEVLVHPVSVRSNGTVIVTPGAAAPVVVGRLSGAITQADRGRVLDQLPGNVLASPAALSQSPPAGIAVVQAGPAAGQLVATPGPTQTPRPADLQTVTVGRTVTDAAVVATFTAALTTLSGYSIIPVEEPARSLVPYDLAGARAALIARCDPAVSHAARRDAMISFGGAAAGSLASRQLVSGGWLLPPLVDRVMAFPRFPRGAYEMLASYDRNRFCPGIDQVPPDSITLLKTNQRFVAAFLAGLNQETERELIWRRFPTDQRGTPFQHFWTRLDGRDDIPPMHTWSAGSLAEQTSDPAGALVLLVRGQLLKRYPNTIVVAVPAAGPHTPSSDPDAIVVPILAGKFDPDVSFFGFSLELATVLADPGWFFALMEPPTEPRLGLDETSTTRNDIAWPNITGAAPGKHLTTAMLQALPVTPIPRQADQVAATLFQRPFKLVVLAKYLVKEKP